MSIRAGLEGRHGEGADRAELNQETTHVDATLEAAQLPSIAARARLAGRILSAIPALFLMFDGSIKLAHLPAVAEAQARLGMEARLSTAIGVLELTCLALYLVPRTAVIGAVLLTGFLGGAVAMHVRIGDPIASHTLFPVYVGAMVWAGLWLRDARLRAIVAPRRSSR